MSTTSNLCHILHWHTISTVQMQQLDPPIGSLRLNAPQAPCVSLYGFPNADFGPQGLWAE